MRYLRKPFILIFIIFFHLGCHDHNQKSIDPNAQELIQWTSLANAPWPAYNHDHQNTNRAEYYGPSNPSMVVELTFGINLQAPLTIDNVGNIYIPDYNSCYKTNPINSDSIILLFQFHESSYSYTAPLITFDNRVIFTQYNGTIAIYDVLQNTLCNTFNVDDNVWVNPMLDLSGNILISGMQRISKVNPDGTVIWNLEIPNIYSCGFSPDGGTCYFTDFNRIYAVDNESGVIINTYNGQDIEYPTISNGGDLFFNDFNDTSVTCLDPDFNEVWKYYYGRHNGIYLSPYSGTLDYDGNYYTTGIADTINQIMSFSYDGQLNWIQNIVHNQENSLLCDRNNDIYFIGEELSTNTIKLSSFGEDGMINWQLDLPNQIYETPIITPENKMILPALRSGSRNLILIE